MKASHLIYNANKIAIIRTDKLGDMVLTLPMVNLIKKVNPKAEIHIIAHSYTEFLLKNQVNISNYHFVDKIEGGINPIFKNNNFDVAFFPRPRFDEALSAFLNKVPLRVGSGYRYYSILFNKRIFEHRKNAEKTEAQYNVDMINSILQSNEKYELIKPYIPNDAINKINSIVNEIGKYIIIHPGGGGSAPKLSKEKFSVVAEYIINNFDNKYSVVLTGVENELNLCNYIEKINPKVINLCGKLSLEESSALIDKAEGIIVNSTGIMHIAVALKKNVIALFPEESQRSISYHRWGHINDKTINLSSKASVYSSEVEKELNIDINEIIQSLIKLIKFK